MPSPAIPPGPLPGRDAPPAQAGLSPGSGAVSRAWAAYIRKEP